MFITINPVIKWGNLGQPQFREGNLQFFFVQMTNEDKSVLCKDLTFQENDLKWEDLFNKDMSLVRTRLLPHANTFLIIAFHLKIKRFLYSCWEGDQSYK